MGDSKYGIKPSFILTVDESFTLLRDQYHITRHLFDFLSGPYFQNFESMKGEQSGHLREEARREARHANRPLSQRPVVAEERSGGGAVYSIGTSSSRLSTRVPSPTRPLSEYLFLNWANEAPGKNAASGILMKETGSIYFSWNVCTKKKHENFGILL